MIRFNRPIQTIALLVMLVGAPVTTAFAQDVEPAELPTLFSVKASAGYGLGRARQMYGHDGSSEVWWSTGQGAKLNLALDLPIIPVDVVDSLGSNSGTVPVVGLELEAASGYHLSTGGTTNDPIGGGVFQTTTRTTSYIPVTLGLNARTSFGGGLPSIYIGAGGGVWIVGTYQEDVSFSDHSTGFTRKMHPPIPFGLYGAIGFELPLMYDPNDANSMFDLFAEVRLTEMTTYVYEYDAVTNGTSNTVSLDPLSDPSQPYPRDAARSASNVSLSIGFKYNLY